MSAVAERANVMVAGSGGREHAMVAALRRSPYVNEIFVAPGNAGTDTIATNIPISATDIDRQVSFAKDNNVGLYTAGSENTFVLGAVNAMREAGVDAYGVDQEQAQLETDKILSHKMMVECGIPCPDGVAAENYEDAQAFLANPPWEFVIKAAGPCGGKGVELPENIDEAKRIVDEFMLGKKHGEAGERILFQKREYGPETSLIAFVNGETVVGLPKTSDYKLKLTGNKGPNTGGMGCIIEPNSEPPKEWLDAFIQPIATRYAQDGNPLNSFVYAQLIHTQDGIKVLEYNMRGGDPETQTQFRLLKPGADFYLAMRQSLNGIMDPKVVEFDYEKAASTLVLAAEGYPEKPRTGDPIQGLTSLFEDGVVLFNAGTSSKDGVPVTSGGRVLNMTATGDTLYDAVVKMYRAADSKKVYFNGMWYRDDIGVKYGN